MSLAPVLLCANSTKISFLTYKVEFSEDYTDLETFLGPDWPKEKPRYYVPCYRGEPEHDCTVYRSPDVPHEATHLVLLEGEAELGKQNYWFNGEAINGSSMLLFFNQYKQFYFAMESEEIVDDVIAYCDFYQGEWYAQSEELHRRYKGHYGSSL